MWRGTRVRQYDGTGVLEYETATRQDTTYGNQTNSINDSSDHSQTCHTQALTMIKPSDVEGAIVVRPALANTHKERSFADLLQL